MFESIVNLIQYGLLGLFGFFFVGWLGFRIPSRNQKPKIISITPESSPAPNLEKLPAPVQRYLRILYPSGLPASNSLVAWGRGRISSRLRMFGSVWLPLSWSLFLKPGVGYVWKVTITWFTRRFISGGDQFLDDHGIYKMGSETLESEFIDRSEFTILWINTLVFAPFSLANQENLKWKTIDEASLWLTVPGSIQTWNDFKLIFNSDTGLLTKIQTRRAASRDGELLDFHVDINLDLDELAKRGFTPTARFAWEGTTYLTLSPAGNISGAEVDEAFENGI